MIFCGRSIGSIIGSIIDRINKQVSSLRQAKCRVDTGDRSDLLSDTVIDGHHHLWDPERVELPWLAPELAVLARPFAPADLAPLLEREGIAETILVQSANSDADTDFMLAYAESIPWIGAVVGWVALDDPARASLRLDELAEQRKLRGIRHLIHDEPDPHWIMRPTVLESLADLEERGLVLELPVVYPRHLADVAVLAERFPRLTLVIDHLGKPPLDGDLADWRGALAVAAAHPNVHAKVSGLNTATANADWSADDLRTAFDAALELFGPERLLCGSDWPVLLLNGDYERVWSATRELVADLAPDEQDALLDGTARRLYRLEVTSGAH
jgi:L-fuconolactonase